MTLTADMFTSLTGAIADNVEILVPVGLTILGIMLVPRIIKKVVKGSL